MTRLFPALRFLYLHNSSVDLYLKTLREAIQLIPAGVLRLEYDCFPIITDYSNSEESKNSGIVIGHGFPYSYFKNSHQPQEGLVFCLNPPITRDVENVTMHQTQHKTGIIPVHSSFMIGKHRFLLTDQEYNLDEIVCCELATGDTYHPTEIREDPGFRF